MTKLGIGCDEAEAIADATLFVGRVNNLKPLTVAVIDLGGHLVAFKREDGSSILRESIARGKAYGALGLGMDSNELDLVAAERPAFMTAAFIASDGRIVPAAGGVLILNQHGQVIGAVGVSGDLSAKDEACAIAAIRAVGFRCKAIVENRACVLTQHSPDQVAEYVQRLTVARGLRSRL
eukprot:c17057_g1_i1.p1 GENE.c17057_g1_i1~~c17057_g1_i1.p1  ORF type:complete len:179 (-),score=33.91 c17057_g1_i1:40-576(-)